MIFPGLSLQPTPALSRVVLQLFFTEFSCQLHAADPDVVIPNTLKTNFYKELHHTPVYYCCETLIKSGNIKALASTLDFLDKYAHTPRVMATMGDELTLAMVIAIVRSDAFAESNPVHSHYVRRMCTRILNFMSRTKMIMWERIGPLCQIGFSPVRNYRAR